MSLKFFHLAFILISATLGFFLTFWGYENNRLLAVVGVVLLGAIIPYLFWFRKKMKLLPIVLVSLLFSNPVLACAVCFGDPNSLQTKSAKLVVLFLLGIIVSILASIGGVAFKWSRKSL